MECRRVVLGIVAAALFEGALLAQAERAVVVVDSQMRPGSDYATIQEGVAAVATGGTVMVRFATSGQTGLGPIVIDRSMRLVGLWDPRFGAFPRANEAIEIVRIPASGSVEIRNIDQANRVGCWAGRCPHPVGVSIQDCAGPVLVDACLCTGGPYPGSHIRVDRCANVHIRHSIIEAGETAIHFEQSNVVIEGSLLWSGNGTFFGHAPPRTAVWLGPGADVTLIGSEINAFGTLTWIQAALTLDGGVLRVDRDSVLSSAIPSQALGISASASAPPTGQIWMDPLATWHGWVNPSNAISSPVRIVKATSASPGGSYTAELRGAHPNDWFAAIVASPWPTSPFPNLHPSIGTGPDPDYPLAWLDPTSSTVIYFGAPTGQVTQSVTANVPIGTQTLLQGVFFGTDNVIRMTPPFVQSVVDPDEAW